MKKAGAPLNIVEIIRAFCYTENMKTYDVIVIGGGASGMAVANSLKGLKTAVLESADRAGKKLLASGNGRCNLTNLRLGADFYNDPAFVSHALTVYDVNYTLSFFRRLGLKCAVEETRVYPYSFTSSSVSDVLRRGLDRAGAEVITGCEVTSLEKTDGGFTVKCGSGEYRGKIVVLATGSNAGTGLDSTALAVRLGHKSKKFAYGLNQIKCDTSRLKGLSGVRVKCALTLFKYGQERGREQGEVLFKDYGLSGIAAFNLSSLIARERGEGYTVAIDFMPDLDREEVAEELATRCDAGFTPDNGLLTGLFHKQIAANLLNAAAGNTQAERLASLTVLIKNYEIKVKSLLGNQTAQVASGGLLTDEFDNKTMESVICKGFYAVGEVLDADGLCGGYNLQWAWSSAFAAAEDIRRKLIKQNQ